jgi:uncharacterized protein (DUF58 family)
MADVDLRGVTDWHSGAQLGDVHWRSLARSGRPAVLERERATPSCLVVVVMAAPTKHGRWRDDPGFERAVSVAAAALSETARTGEPTCLVAPETSEAALGRVPHTGYGSALLDRLARLTVTAEPQPALMRHAVEHAGRGGNVLLVANNATPGKWVSRLLDAAAKADVNVIDARKVLGQADSLAPVAGPR